MTDQRKVPSRAVVHRARLFVASYLRHGDPALAAKAVSSDAKDLARAGRDLLENPEVKAELRYQLAKSGWPPGAVLLLIKAKAAACKVMRTFGLMAEHQALPEIKPPEIQIVLVESKRRD